MKPNYFRPFTVAIHVTPFITIGVFPRPPLKLLPTSSTRVFQTDHDFSFMKTLVSFFTQDCTLLFYLHKKTHCIYTFNIISDCFVMFCYIIPHPPSTPTKTRDTRESLLRLRFCVFVSVIKLDLHNPKKPWLMDDLHPGDGLLLLLLGHGPAGSAAFFLLRWSLVLGIISFILSLLFHTVWETIPIIHTK